MRSRLIAIIAAGVLLALSPLTARSEEGPGARRGPALERIRAQVQKLRAEGKSDTEILKALRGMIDRALAQQQGGAKTPREKVSVRAPAPVRQQAKAAPAAAEKACTCPLCPHNRARPERSLQVQERIQAAARKMRAEGKSPVEIQAAVQKMKERAMKALQAEAAGSVPAPVRKKAESPEKKPGPPARPEKAPPAASRPQQKAPVKARNAGEL